MNGNCEQWHVQMAAYADRELSPGQVTAFLEHARDCPSCACEALAQVTAKSAVQSAGTRYAAPGELRARVARAIAPPQMAPPQKERFSISASADAPAPPPPVWAHWRQFAVAAAAVVLLAAGLLVTSRLDR